jgi:uncharacterized protein (DUF4415 family)
MFTGRTPMAKKSSVLSQPARLKTTASEDIKNRKWSEKEIQMFERLAARQAVGDESHINFDDIPRVTDEQFLQHNAFPRSPVAQDPVSVRLDPRVLEWLKSKGEGHLTRINDILMNLMEAEQRARHT